MFFHTQLSYVTTVYIAQSQAHTQDIRLRPTTLRIRLALRSYRSRHTEATEPCDGCSTQCSTCAAQASCETFAMVCAKMESPFYRCLRT